MIDCPALHERFPEKGYPFGNRVPAKIRMLKSVTSDFPMFFADREPLYAEHGSVYDAWTNSYGAVAAVLSNGKNLGLKPGEFEVIEWHEVKA